MHNWIELNAPALRHNLATFQQLLGKERTAIVLKSNAYGHGLAEAYACLKSQSIAWICTNYLSEAEQLRQLGYAGRILNVGPIFAGDLVAAQQHEVDVFLSKEDTLEAWSRMPKRPRAHIKFDTGLSRQGFLFGEAGNICSRVQPFKDSVVGICTHFANVEDVLEHQYADLQLQRFNEVDAKFQAAGMKLLRHAASSASSMILPESQFDLCRVGISLYGLWPSQPTKLSYKQMFGKTLDLLPVLTWKTRVNLVKTVAAGDYVGYGCTYRASKPMRLALIPVGYYEGYPRIAGNSQAFVLIRGSRCPLVGRISMNMMVVDASHLSEIKVEDEVVLIGKQHNDLISASDLAGWAQTIHYELVTRLHGQIPRKLVES
jgi:alanine racemase